MLDLETLDLRTCTVATLASTDTHLCAHARLAISLLTINIGPYPTDLVGLWRL